MPNRGLSRPAMTHPTMPARRNGRVHANGLPIPFRTPDRGGNARGVPALLVLLLLWRAGLLSTFASDDLQALSDEFDDPATLGQWQRVVETEGWGNDALASRSLSGERPGWLRLIPHTSTWYAEWRGELMFKTVTGDFVITTDVEPRDRAGLGAPNALYSLAGIMVRAPLAQRSPLEWQPGLQNYVFLSLGAANTPGGYQFEVKTTTASASVLEIEPGVARAEIRVARVGPHLLMLRRAAGGVWRVHRRYFRPDLPATLQAGLTVYTDWPLCESVGFAWQNTHVLTNGAPAPGGGILAGAHPDLRADFDFVRYARPVVPTNLVGANLSDPAAVTDDALLGFLGDLTGEPPPPPPAGTAELTLTTNVLVVAPERFGFNLQAPLLNNFTSDPGFEPTLIRRPFLATGGGADFIENRSGPTASFYQTLTNGFFDGAGVRVYRPQPAGPVQWLRQGRVLRYAVDEQRVYLDAPGPEIQAGDYYVLEMLAANPPRDRLDPRMTYAAANDPWRPVGGAEWPFGLPVEASRDTTTVAPENGGRSSVRLSTPGVHEVSLRQPHFSSRERYGGYYPPLVEGRRYRIEVWLKQTGIPNGQARVFLTQHYATVATNFVVGANWEKHTCTFAAPATPPGTEGIAEVGLAFAGPGSLWADNFFLYEDDDLDPTTYPVFAPQAEAAQAMAAFQPGPVRLWAGQANTTWGTALETLIDPENLRPNTWHADQGKVPPEFGFSLATALPLVRQIGGTPWIIVSPGFDEDEWRGLIEYLAAPFDPAVDTAATKPWAARRYAQGQPAPWSGEFARLRIEFGNETWNNFFQFTFPNGDLAGQFASHFFQIAQQSPWFASLGSQTDFIVNGWTVQPGLDGYGHAAIQRSPEARMTDLTGYLSGWELGSQFGSNVTDVAFQDLLLFPAGSHHYFSSQHAAARDQLAAAGRDSQLAIYEGGPGYPLPAPGSEFQPVAETYGKSLAAGTATLDLFLDNTRQRIDPQAFFAFQAGPNWTSHTNDGSAWRAHPSWLALQLRNQLGRGDLLDVPIQSSPVIDLPASGFEGTPIPGFPGTPLIAAHAFRDGDHYAVFLLSRQLTNATAITLHLPFDHVSSASRYDLTGDPRANNVTADPLRVTSTPLALASSNLTLMLPPASVVALEFSGAETLPPTEGMTWARWVSGHAWPIPEAALPAADPDADGRSNLEEYASGTDPLSGATLDRLSATRASGALDLRFPLDPRAREVRWTLEISDDLQSWQPGPTYHADGVGWTRDANPRTTQVDVQVDGARRVVTERAAILAPPSSRQFFRLKFSLNSAAGVSQ